MTPPGPDIPERDLDGHSMDDLVDYLDRGRTPTDPTIENSPGCQIALGALTRLRTLSETLLEAEAAAEPPRDDTWVSDILSYIGMEARAGRDIPLGHENPEVELSISEGAVRGLIRAAGDEAGGVLMGRCGLEGDVTVPGEPITVTVETTVLWGEPIPAAVARVRAAIAGVLRKHTELNLVAVDVMVSDVQATAEPDADADADADSDARVDEPTTRPRGEDRP